MKPESECYQNRIELLQGTRYAYPPDLAVGATARTRNQPIHGRALGVLNLEFDIWNFSHSWMPPTRRVSHASGIGNVEC